jgi:hypothetical protein
VNVVAFVHSLAPWHGWRLSSISSSSSVAMYSPRRHFLVNLPSPREEISRDQALFSLDES